MITPTAPLASASTAASAGRALAAAAAFAWPDGAKAAVSLTYDDGLDTQLDHGMAQIAASGFEVTFFVTKENMDERLADWIKVARLGRHEFGNHTISHPCGLQPYTAASYARGELMPMQAYWTSTSARTPSALRLSLQRDRPWPGDPNAAVPQLRDDAEARSASAPRAPATRTTR